MQRERESSFTDSVTVDSVNTPTKTNGVGAGFAADLTYWESAARMIARVSKSPKIIVEKSTVPGQFLCSLRRVEHNLSSSDALSFQ